MAGENQSSAGTARELREALGREMRAARKQADMTIRGFLDHAALKYSVGHISSVEHGRDRPRLELVVAYDDSFSPDTDKGRLVGLWRAMQAREEAEERARDAAEAQERGLPLAPCDPAPTGPEQARPADRVLAFVGAGIVLLAAACFVFFVLLAMPSREEFAREANEICVRAEQPLRAVQTGLTRVGVLLAQGDQEAGNELRRQIAAVRRLIAGPVKQLDDLDQPSGKAGERAGDFVEGTKRAAIEGLNILVDMAENIAAGDGPRALQQLRDRSGFDGPALGRDILAGQIGASDCARVQLRRAWGRASAP